MLFRVHFTLYYFLGLGMKSIQSIEEGQPTQKCPPLPEIAPCTCGIKKNGLDVICEFTDFVHISRAMDSLKKRQSSVIFYLKLRHNNLPKLQGFVFLGLDIHHLTIHNSSLAVVEETALSSIGKALTQLDISQNILTSVPSIALKTLHHLLILNINHNRINVIHKKAFEGLDTLEILTLYENKISSIESDGFRGLDKRKLKRLNLGGNELHQIPTSSLSSLDILKKLEMQENGVPLIKAGDFHGLKNLDSLGLAHNHLQEIPARVFSELTLLNSLELDGNQITIIDSNAFIGLEENLQYLKLGDNNLHTVPSDALRRLHRLRHLDLKANNITSLAEDAFTGYGDSITFLNLQKNMIKTLPSLLFETLNSLEILNLQNNQITYIPEDVMENIVDTLKLLDITDNPLICHCDFNWFRIWLAHLHDKDDEIMSKRRTVCTMVSEHREYAVQKMPLQKLGCSTNEIDDNSLSSSNQLYVRLIFLFCYVLNAFIHY